MIRRIAKLIGFSAFIAITLSISVVAVALSQSVGSGPASPAYDTASLEQSQVDR